MGNEGFQPAGKLKNMVSSSPAGQTEEQWKAYFNMILNTALQFVLLEFYYYHPNVLDSQKNWSFRSKNNFSNVYVGSTVRDGLLNVTGAIETDIHNMFSPDNPMKLRDR